MLLLCLKRFLIAFVLLGIHCIAFAESAPVYDVDNYPPQFDGEPVTAEPSPSISKLEAPAVPVQQTLTQEQRLMRIEQQMKNLVHSDSALKSEATQAEIQSLRAQVEELTHQLQQAQNQQRLMYSDMDKRLSQTSTEKKILPSTTHDATIKKTPVTTASEAHTASIKKPASTSAVPAPVKEAAAHNDQPNVAEEQQIYQTAYDLIKAKKYNEAINTLQKMLQKYPTGQFAANAHYWLGELYGLLNKNDESAKEFATIVKNYPDSSKVADAQLKLGLIYAAQFKWPDAKTAFKKVVSHYPGTASARLASEQLKQLKQAQANNR